MAKQAERRSRTRQAILAVAKQLFERQGYEATPIDQIIKQADIAKGTFYQHFATKLDVLMVLEREAAAGKTRAALAALKAGEPALIILQEYLQTLGDWFEGHEKIAETLILASLTKSNDEDGRHPELTGRGFVHALLQAAQQQGGIREDRDPWELTRMLGGLIAASVLNWCQSPKKGELGTDLKRSLETFLQGIECKPVRGEGR